LLRIWCSTVVLSILCVFSACTVTRVRQPERDLEPLSLERGHEVVSKLNTERLSSVRRLFQATFSTDSEQYTLRLAFVFSEPNSLRIELLPLNSSVSLNLITSVNGRATYIDWSEKLVVRGTLSDLLELSFLESPLSDAQIRSVLGSILVSAAIDTKMEIYQVPSGYIFASPRAYYVTDSDFRIKEFEIGGSDGSVLVRGAQLGDDLHIELVEGGHDLTLRLLKEKLSEPVSERLFSPVSPAGFSVRHID
jgi:hypothetical protein